MKRREANYRCERETSILKMFSACRCNSFEEALQTHDDADAGRLSGKPLHRLFGSGAILDSSALAVLVIAGDGMASRAPSFPVLIRWLQYPLASTWQERVLWCLSRPNAWSCLVRSRDMSQSVSARHRQSRDRT